MNTYSKTIVIIGGHITPALALMDELKRQHHDWRLVCIGRNVLERALVTQKGVMFLNISAGRLSSWYKIPVGFVQAFWDLIRVKPDIVVSFGGYVALPVALSAWILGIPIVTHEQTRIPGLANRIIGRIAAKICLTFEDTEHRFSKKKVVITGLPIRRELFSSPKKPSFELPGGDVMYITGGSTGAVSMNELLFDLIPKLVKRYVVIHQTGVPSLTKASAIRNPRYIAKDFFDVKDVSWILYNAALVVGRSGANTVMEVAMIGKPMICIPLPWSAGSEQFANASWLVKKGLGAILIQKDFTQSRFLGLIRTQKTKQTSFEVPFDGSERMAGVINAILAS